MINFWDNRHANYFIFFWINFLFFALLIVWRETTEEASIVKFPGVIWILFPFFFNFFFVNFTMDPFWFKCNDEKKQFYLDFSQTFQTNPGATQFFEVFVFLINYFLLNQTNLENFNSIFINYILLLNSVLIGGLIGVFFFFSGFYGFFF